MRIRALAGLAFCVPALLSAQDRRPCEIVITGVVRSGVTTTRMQTIVSEFGGRNTYIGGGVDATCEGQDNRLLADSAEHFADRGLLILYHNVRYTESRVRITSDKMFYYTREERIVAEGNVRGVRPSGTRFAGPQFEYFRVKPGLRDHPTLIATGRPFMRISPTESGGTPGTDGDSTDITANRIYSFNDSLVWASGAVVIERSDMRATSDSATLDNGIEFARLLRDPKIVGRGEREFTLVGIVVDMWSKDRQLERVLAAGEGKATSDSLTLTADTIDLRLREQQMERVFSWGGRARAVSANQDIESDSMDITMPGQELERVHAIGRAIAYSVPDTARIISTERDWILGDTIDARFERATDSLSGESQTRMRQIDAVGGARAFYQQPPSGTERGKPILSYNRGRSITVRFAEGEMSTVTVSEAASGLYLEPIAATGAPTAPPTPPSPPAGTPRGERKP